MIAHVAYAEGAPCPTLVLDAGMLPAEEERLRIVLTAVRRRLIEAGAAEVLKIALIEPARHPLFDLDYRFVQCLSGGVDRFDFRGSCGHSILAAIMVASRTGWIPKLTPEARVRVNVLNNGDHVVCEVDEAVRARGSFTVHFVHNPATRLGDLLLTSEPLCHLRVDGAQVPVSLVSAGNPYVLVDAASLGLRGEEELFADDPELFAALSRIRSAAAGLLGWDPEGAFPKIAALGQFRPGRLAARAISVPGWHPTLALTGTICLGISAAIADTIPHRLASRAGSRHAHLEIDTPGGATVVATEVSGTGPDDRLHWASVGRKQARLTGSVLLDPLPDVVLKEREACLLA